MPEEYLRIITYGCISAKHAGMFLAFTKTLENKHLLSDIIKGEARFPDKPEERDVLYFIAQSFRGKLLQELPKDKQKIGKDTKFFEHRAKAMIKELASINTELAQMVVASDEDESLPDWFMLEVVRDLPRLVTNAE